MRKGLNWILVICFGERKRKSCLKKRSDFGIGGFGG